MGNSSSSSLPALQTVASCDTSRFMGTWFVIAVKPTVFETKSSNCVEKYTFLDSGKTSHDIDIDFTYNEEAPLTSKIKALPQKGYVQGDKYNSAVWKVSPMWPIKLGQWLLQDISNVALHLLSIALFAFDTLTFLLLRSSLEVFDD